MKNSSVVLLLDLDLDFREKRELEVWANHFSVVHFKVPVNLLDLNLI